MIGIDPHQRRRAKAAGAWLKAERERLGWSVDDLCAAARDMAEVHPLDPDVLHRKQPLPKQIEELESGKCAEPPRWLRSAYHAIEAAALNPDAQWELRKERNHWYRNHAWDASHPMVFHNEYRLIQRLGQDFSSSQRRAIEQFVARWHSPYRGEREAALNRLAAELGFEAKVGKL